MKWEIIFLTFLVEKKKNQNMSINPVMNKVNSKSWSELEIHPAEARHPDGADGAIFETPDPDRIRIRM